MSDPTMLLTLGSIALVSVSITSVAVLRAWTGWLELKRLELNSSGGGAGRATGGKLELKELKDRVRKLEAIASGTEI